MKWNKRTNQDSNKVQHRWSNQSEIKSLKGVLLSLKWWLDCWFNRNLYNHQSRLWVCYGVRKGLEENHVLRLNGAKMSVVSLWLEVYTSKNVSSGRLKSNMSTAIN